MAPPVLHRLSETLKQARLDARQSQVEVARRLRRLQSFVLKLESGEYQLDVIELADLCRIYKLDVCEFTRRLGL